MNNTIPLPPLPEPVYTYDEDGNKVYYEKAKLVRARDQEIVRCVLEAAAKVARDAYLSELADAIRALEFHHE